MSRARADIVIVGGGAAGLMAAVWAGRTAQAAGRTALRIAVLDGARRIGAKILVAGGGRCNVTHHAVDETAYAGSSRPAIRKVLGRFGVDRTVEFFDELGVELKREETGKLFPVSDDAHTVLDALLGEVKRVGVSIVQPWRVGTISARDGGFEIAREVGGGDDELRGGDELRRAEVIEAGRVVLATGGMALPKTGSDGKGYSLARSLGHTVTPHVFPALVPLTLAKGHVLCSLSGVTLPATLELRSDTGKRLVSFTNSTLLTHFGLSGPSVLDISRYFTASRLDGGGGRLFVNFLPGETVDSVDAELASQGRSGSQTVVKYLSKRLPERLARGLIGEARIDEGALLASLARGLRRKLAELIAEFELDVTGDRGFTFAEVTAGGIPLAELNLATMESRVHPGLWMCGEICDVDGRIGGFNFQWAWASGHVAGCAVATIA